MHIGNSTKIALIRYGKDNAWLAEQLGIQERRVRDLVRQQFCEGRRLEQLAEAFDMSERDFIGLADIK